MTDRRTLLRGLIAAPFVITTPGLLMPVRPWQDYGLTPGEIFRIDDDSVPYRWCTDRSGTLAIHVCKWSHGRLHRALGTRAPNGGWLVRDDAWTSDWVAVRGRGEA